MDNRFDALFHPRPDNIPGLCAAIGALPFQLASRFLGEIRAPDLAAQLDAVRKVGGACFDKASLLRATLEGMGLECEFALAGFGATERIDPGALARAIDAEPDIETFPHSHHIAVILKGPAGDRLLDANGGRVGVSVFDPATTKDLLAGDARVRCVNVKPLLVYHRFPAFVAEKVVGNMRGNPRLVANIIRRIGIAVAGRWAVFIREIPDEGLDPDGAAAAKGRTFNVLENAEALRAHPFARCVDGESIETLVRACAKAMSTLATSPGQKLRIIVETSSVNWGSASEVVWAE
jgi:hypothetical protein